MKYENTTYKLAAYIGTLEKVAERRTQYLADSEKVTQDAFKRQRPCVNKGRR